MVRSVVGSTDHEMQIVLLLPFYVDKNIEEEKARRNASLNDTLILDRPKKYEEQIFERSEIALHFYEGLLLAVDSLSKLGYAVNIKVIDTENRPWKVQQLIKTGKLSDSDLIIGPFYSKVFTKVAEFAERHCIPIISPTIRSNAIIKENPYVFKLIPSPESMVFEMGRYVAASDSTNNLILHYGREDEQLYIWKFRQALESIGVDPSNFPSYNVYRVGKDSIRMELSLSSRNNVIVLSENQVSLNSMVRSLSDWSEDTYIVCFAPNSWSKFKSMDVDHFDRLRLRMPKPFFIDYERLEVQNFVKEFRERYQTEPNTFAFRGYDIGMHFIQNLDGIVNDGPDYMLSVRETGL
ncbi:MAG: ABC transporter substrate-binding protein, partial [Flavobacteriales bacterium]|nr:ABC transporter substrate-binding protein [Flavobacteriales bacterium]